LGQLPIATVPQRRSTELTAKNRAPESPTSDQTVTLPQSDAGVVIALNTLTRRNFPPAAVRSLDAVRLCGGDHPRHAFPTPQKSLDALFFPRRRAGQPSFTSKRISTLRATQNRPHLNLSSKRMRIAKNHRGNLPALPEKKNVATAIAKMPTLATIKAFVMRICLNNAGSVIGISFVRKKTLLNFLWPLIEKSDGRPSFSQRSFLRLSCL
jgi:hypothetical protein